VSEKRLTVLLGGQNAGTLSLVDGNLQFEYDDDYRAAEAPTPLSLSLPVAQRRHSGTRLANYLWGLLPDNERVLERWAATFDTTKGSVFGLLAGAGEDCAGAVQFVRPERLSVVAAAKGSRAFVDESWIGDRIRAVRADSAAWLPPGDPSTGQWSLAGAQPKFALARRRQGWSKPSGTAPTTHIFKPNTSPFVDFDVNEYLCLSVARHVGVAAARAALMTFDGERVLVVERYDRVNGVRVHQEDICQALGTHPQRKYQNAKGPSVTSVRDLLEARVSADQRRIVAEQLLQALACHWLLLNTDGHAKNFSLLLSGSSVRLAPLYDLASACLYQRSTPGRPVVGELRSTGLRLALSIGREYDANRIDAGHWRLCAADLGLDAEWAVATVHTMVQRLPDAVHVASASLEDHSTTTARFVELMERRAARCVAALDGKKVSGSRPSGARRVPS
jgi:serine/threonine-protein kinase HipA